MVQTLSIFIDVVIPVFAIAVMGYLLKPKLNLDAGTFSRAIYYVFLPALIFNVISQAEVQLDQAMRMVTFILLVCIGCAVLGFGLARLLRRPMAVCAAYALIAVYGNVGNFGLSINLFRWGDAALVPATIYLVIVNAAGLIIGVALASLVRGRRLSAMLSVVKTPALIILLPAFAFQLTHYQIPLFASRIIDMLGDAAIPLLLFTLGIQLAGVKKPRIDRDVLLATGVRLIGGPVLALLFIAPFHLSGLDYKTGIMQASMPAAVLTSIIAMENDLEPDFVTTTVFFSTLVSVVTLTAILTFL